MLTTCGNPGRRLSIGETYLAGVGGGCNPIDGWSPSQDFTAAELNLLRALRVADQSVLCGAMVSIPSLLTLILAVLLIFMVAA